MFGMPFSILNRRPQTVQTSSPPATCTGCLSIGQTKIARSSGLMEIWELLMGIAPNWPPGNRRQPKQSDSRGPLTRRRALPILRVRALRQTSLVRTRSLLQMREPRLPLEAEPNSHTVDQSKTTSARRSGRSQALFETAARRQHVCLRLTALWQTRAWWPNCSVRSRGRVRTIRLPRLLDLYCRGNSQTQRGPRGLLDSPRSERGTPLRPGRSYSHRPPDLSCRPAASNNRSGAVPQSSRSTRPRR